MKRLNVLERLFTLKGSEKYLSDMKESFKSVKCALIYKMSSIEENQDIRRDYAKTCISTDDFNNDQCVTHIVIEIKWGANNVIDESLFSINFLETFFLTMNTIFDFIENLIWYEYEKQL